MKPYKYMLKTKAEREAEHDLVWLYCFSEADCGIKSNYQSMVNVAIFGEPTSYHEPYNSFILQSVDHKRKLEAILRQLPLKYQRILFGSFGDVRFSLMIANIFNKFTASAYLNTYLTPTKLESLCVKFYQGNITGKDQIMMSNIRNQATKNYYVAIQKYIKAKRDMNRRDRQHGV